MVCQASYGLGVISFQRRQRHGAAKSWVAVCGVGLGTGGVCVDLVIAIAGGVGGLALGIVAGFRVGSLVQGQAKWRYWILNGVAMLMGLLGDVAGLTLGAWWLVVGSLAFIGGALTGLKYGYRAVRIVTSGDDGPDLDAA